MSCSGGMFDICGVLIKADAYSIGPHQGVDCVKNGQDEEEVLSV